MQRRKYGNMGYTLLELCVTLFIICITAMIIYPIIAPPHREKARQSMCASHLKQIGLAVLAYAQDNGETLPPSTETDKQTGPFVSLKPPVTRFWLGQSKKVSSRQDAFQSGAGFLESYLKNGEVYHCPETQGASQIHWNTEQYGRQTVYMTNDLAGGAKLKSFVNPLVTVIAMDGATAQFTTGHVMFGSAATRHSGGANYLFADGHVKWNRPVTVFFPPGESSNLSHLDPQFATPIGPAPGGDMRFYRSDSNQKYTATFHLL